MIEQLLPMASMATITTVAVLGAIFYVVQQRQPYLESETVYPFAPTPKISTSEDTLVNESLVRTVFHDQPDWKLTTFTRLSEVEDLLDYLENQNVRHREVHTLGNNCFAVRWK